MELSPQAVAAATFKTVKRGYDPDEVRAYLIEVSASLEASHQQATAMEARARAAIAKLQDATQNAQHTGSVPIVAPVVAPSVGADEAETISRTLLLAQRTADTTVAQAQAEATSITESAQAGAAGVTAAARLEAASTLEQARAEAARLLDEARTEAHRAKTEQHLRAETEVKELESRRNALIADIDTLVAHGAQHRDRLREASSALAQLADQVPAEIDRPALRAPVGAATPSLLNGDDTGGHRIPPPPITGQVPLQPGVEPLVSPRPTSADEVRTMWQQAERADQAGLIDATPVDATPVDGTPGGGTPGGGTPGDGNGFDTPTPADGIRR